MTSVLSPYLKGQGSIFTTLDIGFVPCMAFILAS